MYTVEDKKCSKTALISNYNLESAMNSVIDYKTGFNSSNISTVNKTSYAKGVYTVLDSLTEACEKDIDLTDNKDLVSMIFSVPGSKRTMDNFLNRLSSDLGCKKFTYNQNTLIKDMKEISKYLKNNFPEDDFDFNSFMSGVRGIIGPIKKTYDKIPKTLLWIANKTKSFNLEKKTRPIVDKLASEINELYYNYFF